MEHNDRAWLAHTTAKLGRIAKFPELSALLVGESVQRKHQTWQEQLTIMSVWAEVHNKKFGEKLDG